jgi:hypothetical protein
LAFEEDVLRFSDGERIAASGDQFAALTSTSTSTSTSTGDRDGLVVDLLGVDDVLVVKGCVFGMDSVFDRFVEWVGWLRDC